MRAEHSQRFFKTYEGGYAEGDVFLGLPVPTTRKTVKKYTNLPLSEIEILLDSPIHEHRFAAVVILVNKAKKAADTELKQIYDFYLSKIDRINNWDIVDVSCRDIVGKYLRDKPRDPLYELAKSRDIWERRIAIVSTWWFIRDNDLDDTFALSEKLLHDKHDLIHKAVGWMLREAGKKDEVKLRLFLDKHAHEMPRTMLRYAIDNLDSSDRKYYMYK
jgi:3-methyladenine DNA glycosylase AlkD